MGMKKFLLPALLVSAIACCTASANGVASVNVGYCSAARWISGDTLSPEKPAPVLFAGIRNTQSENEIRPVGIRQMTRLFFFHFALSFRKDRSE